MCNIYFSKLSTKKSSVCRCLLLLAPLFFYIIYNSYISLNYIKAWLYWQESTNPRQYMYLEYTYH